MALFVVRHQHSADRCPAHDPYMGAKLLNYLSRPSVRQHGVRIQGEAVVQNEHTFYLIVEAADEVGLRAFMEPFEMYRRAWRHHHSGSRRRPRRPYSAGAS